MNKIAKKKMSEQEREKLCKIHRESDAHIAVTRNGKKLIDNGKLTALGEKMTKTTNKEKDRLREKLYRRDGWQCHYCGIREEFMLIDRKKRFHRGSKK